jgi:hypothetical protein
MLGEIAYWHEWDVDAAERHVRRALALDPRSADALQALGNYDAAFRWLERAYETPDFLCVVLPLEGMFRFVGPGHDRSIVDDPRWLELVRRVGMVTPSA